VFVDACSGADDSASRGADHGSQAGRLASYGRVAGQ
jgi:hypothetical protein